MSIVHDIITADELSVATLNTLFDKASYFKNFLTSAVPVASYLYGKTAINMFFENSTRTRISFELAQKLLGMHSIDFNTSVSSLSKGESFEDTIHTINAMKFDVAIIRHSSFDKVRDASKLIDCPVVNAGAGTTSHPTQAMLDTFTLLEHFKTLHGKRIVIIGDVAHSRVAQSQMSMFPKFGAEVYICNPYPINRVTDKDIANCCGVITFDEAIKTADVLSLLRFQVERGAEFPEIPKYCITDDIMKLTKDTAVVIHPGPINQNMEISYEVAYSNRSLITTQVTNGVAIRMALIHTLLS